MNKRTEKALLGSIQKWVDIAYNGGKDKGRSNCPLCKLFIDNGCEKCPVNEVTDYNCCSDTPYSDWTQHSSMHHTADIVGSFHAQCKTCQRLAEKEAKFLMKLMPYEMEIV